MTDLEALAARVEGATGPDRELDAWVWWHGCADQSATDGDLIEAFNADPPSALDNWAGSRWRTNTSFPPAYTASLDAAMSLIPDSADAAGERFRLEAYNSPGVLPPHVRASAWVAGAPRVYAATPALALTAAALRARAHLTAGATHDR